MKSQIKNYIKSNLIPLLIGVCCFSSCVEPKEQKAPTKPFIIKFKYPNSARAADGYCRYEYYDKNGTTFEFFDLPDKYHVGDTIK